MGGSSRSSKYKKKKRSYNKHHSSLISFLRPLHLIVAFIPVAAVGVVGIGLMLILHALIEYSHFRIRRELGKCKKVQKPPTLNCDETIVEEVRPEEKILEEDQPEEEEGEEEEEILEEDRPEEGKERISLKKNQLENCSICLEGYEDEKKRKVVRLIHCNHVFHFSCIKQWIERQQSCPYCRRFVDHLPKPVMVEDADAFVVKVLKFWRRKFANFRRRKSQVHVKITSSSEL